MASTSIPSTACPRANPQSAERTRSVSLLVPPGAVGCDEPSRTLSPTDPVLRGLLTLWVRARMSSLSGYRRVINERVINSSLSITRTRIWAGPTPDPRPVCLAVRGKGLLGQRPA